MSTERRKGGETRTKSQKIKCDKIYVDEDPILRARRFGSDVCLFWKFIKVILPMLCKYTEPAKRTPEWVAGWATRVHPTAAPTSARLSCVGIRSEKVEARGQCLC